MHGDIRERKNTLTRFTPILLAGLVLTTVSVVTAGAKPKDKGEKHENHGAASQHSREGERPGWGQVPPGWSKGRKTGWEGRSLPPTENRHGTLVGRVHSHAGARRR